MNNVPKDRSCVINVLLITDMFHRPSWYDLSLAGGHSRSGCCRPGPSGTRAALPSGPVWPTRRWPSSSWGGAGWVGTAACRRRRGPAAGVHTAGWSRAAPPCRSTPTQTRQTAPELGILGQRRLPWRPVRQQGTMGRMSPSDDVTDGLQLALRHQLKGQEVEI